MLKPGARLAQDAIGRVLCIRHVLSSCDRPIRTGTNARLPLHSLCHFRSAAVDVVKCELDDIRADESAIPEGLPVGAAETAS